MTDETEKKIEFYEGLLESYAERVKRYKVMLRHYKKVLETEKQLQLFKVDEKNETKDVPETIDKKTIKKAEPKSAEISKGT